MVALSAAAIAIAAAVGLVVSIVWMGLTLGAVYSKAGGRPGLAWVPVMRYVEMARVTQTSIAGTAVARTVAAFGLVVALIALYLPDSPEVVLAGAGVAIIAGTAAWILWIVHTHRLGLDHSLPRALPVLGAVAPGVWAAVVGWSGMIRRREPGPVTAPDPATAADGAAVGAPAAVDPSPVAATPVDPAPVVAAPVADGPAAAGPEEVPAPEVEEWITASGARREEAPAPARSMASSDWRQTPTPAPLTDGFAPRRSPYADLGPDQTAELPTRRSPYADLAPRAAAPSPAPSSEAPSSAATPPAPEPPRPAPGREEAAPVEPEEGRTAGHAAPAPAADEGATPERPVYVEPTPTIPLSPYLRGGASAPPSPPSAVPSFDVPSGEIPAAASPEASSTAPPAAASSPVTPPADAAPSMPTREPYPVRVAPAPVTPDDDRTVVSARQREAWELVTSEGGVYGFDAANVLIGRAGGRPPLDGTPRIDIMDSTRTISKSHARLVLTRGTWLIEDLGSTNGTYLLSREGHEVQVLQGLPTPVTGRLILGDVEVEIRRRGASA